MLIGSSRLLMETHMEMCTTNKHAPSFSDKWRSTEWTTIEPLRMIADLLEIFLPSFPFAIMQ